MILSSKNSINIWALDLEWGGFVRMLHLPIKWIESEPVLFLVGLISWLTLTDEEVSLPETNIAPENGWLEY